MSIIKTVKNGKKIESFGRKIKLSKSKTTSIKISPIIELEKSNITRKKIKRKERVSKQI